MWKNYIKIAWRNMTKKKTNTLINVLGLSTGMAICILLVLFIQDEKSYDGFHDKKDRIYRVALDRIYPGRTTSYCFIPASIGEAIATEFPEVEECTRLFANRGFGSTYIKRDDKTFEEKDVLLADSNFFRVFTSRAVAGDLSTALEKPNSMVLSERTAAKMFGKATEALGKSLSIEEDHFIVTGVVKDWPSKSHFDFTVLISTSSFFQNAPKNYVNFSAHTYLLLKPGTSYKSLEAKLPLIIKKYVAGTIEQMFEQTFEQFQKAGNGYHYFLQPLSSIHLNSDLEGELKANGSERTVNLFMIIAVFLLLIACINFVNLSTARSVERAKEVGIRKTFGSERQALIFQFLYESVLVSLLSMVIALILVLFLIPSLNAIAGKNISASELVRPMAMLIMFVVAVATGVIAGIYPAFILSSFKPILVLKGKLQANSHGSILRNALVVFQFAISVILIIATLVVNMQMRFMTGNDLGFNKDLVVTLQRTDMLGEDPEAFKTELKKINGVEFVTATSALPGTENYFGVSFQIEGSTETHTGRGLMVDESYGKVLDLDMASGRFFSKEFSTDTLSLVINESAVKAMGITGDPVGARFTSPDGQLNPRDGNGKYIYTVIGVVKDFHFQNLHEKIAPLYMLHVRRFTRVDPLMAIRMKGQNYKQTIAGMEKLWSSYIKDRPVHYGFLDQALADLYTKENNTRKLFSIFSIITIIIACLGLLGLITYTVQMRFREIGIRKVLGASIPAILWMLGRSFVIIVLVASLIAIPLAWWGMHKWLMNFEYRIDMPWWVFIVAVVIALLVAIVNISFQAIRAAMMNPVKSLRTE